MKDASSVTNTTRLDEAQRSLSALALVRTAFSSERALMSWMRTSISLYTFGFSISKFLDYVEGRETGIEFSAGLRRLGFALICMGTIALVLAALEHMKRIRTMARLGLPSTSPVSLPLGAVVVLVAIGIVMLVGMP